MNAWNPTATIDDALWSVGVFSRELECTKKS
jgi:hypothetical protein